MLRNPIKSVARKFFIHPHQNQNTRHCGGCFDAGCRYAQKFLYNHDYIKVYSKMNQWGHWFGAVASLSYPVQSVRVIVNPMIPMVLRRYLSLTVKVGGLLVIKYGIHPERPTESLIR